MNRKIIINRRYFKSKDAQERLPETYCDRCLGEVYGEDLVYCIDGQIICADCLSQFAEDYFSRDAVKGEDLRR